MQPLSWRTRSAKKQHKRFFLGQVSLPAAGTYARPPAGKLENMYTQEARMKFISSGMEKG